MAAIPEFQRRKLASSVVGTPGLDLGTAQALADVGGVLAKGAERLGKERRLEERVDRARLERSKEAEAKTGANLQLARFDNDLNNLRKNAIDEDAFIDGASLLLESHEEDITSDRERELFSLAGSGTIRNRTANFRKELQQRTLGKIASNLNQNAEEVASGIANAFNDPDAPLDEKLVFFGEKMDNLIKMAGDAKPELGSAAHLEFSENSANAAASAAVQGLMESNPEDIPEFLSVLGEEAGFSPADISAFLADAKKASDRKKAVSDLLVARDQNQNHHDMTTRITNDISGKSDPSQPQLESHQHNLFRLQRKNP